MPVERAMTAYQCQRLNCAQSVLHAFRESHHINDEEILQAKGLGGGRAEAGLCGALHAALRLSRDSADQERLKTAFVAKAGSVTCREIRRTSRIPCSECVRLAASLIAEHGKTSEGPL
jgi:hypothetical protein